LARASVDGGEHAAMHPGESSIPLDAQMDV